VTTIGTAAGKATGTVSDGDGDGGEGDALIDGGNGVDKDTRDWPAGHDIKVDESLILCNVIDLPSNPLSHRHRVIRMHNYIKARAIYVHLLPNEPMFLVLGETGRMPTVK
jgi:hypothetical protein